VSFKGRDPWHRGTVGWPDPWATQAKSENFAAFALLFLGFLLSREDCSRSSSQSSGSPPEADRPANAVTPTRRHRNPFVVAAMLHRLLLFQALPCFLLSRLLLPDLRGRFVPFRVNNDLAETQGAKLWDQVACAQPQAHHFVACHLEICPRMFSGDR